MKFKKPMYWFNNYKRKVDRGPKNTTEVLQGILQNSKSPLGNAFQTWNLSRLWMDVVGKNIANNSRPKNYYKGTLYIAVKNSVWLQELSFMADPIKEQINQHVGWEWAKKIIFTLEDSADSKGARNARGWRGSPSK